MKGFIGSSGMRYDSGLNFTVFYFRDGLTKIGNNFLSPEIAINLFFKPFTVVIFENCVPLH